MAGVTLKRRQAPRTLLLRMRAGKLSAPADNQRKKVAKEDEEAEFDLTVSGIKKGKP